MLNFKDTAAVIDEPKSARMQQRIKPYAKAQIQQAALLLGVDETTFVTSVALERAQATIVDHERTILSDADREVVVNALNSPAPQTDTLRKIMAMHDARVVQSD